VTVNEAPSYDELKILARMMPGLLFECPMGGNPDDCPLHEIRKLPFIERVQWAKSMTDEQLLDIYRYHKSCLALKESGDSKEIAEQE